MRLHYRDHFSLGTFTRSAQHCGYLDRMMSIVVNDLHPVPLADTGKASSDTPEVGQCATDRLVTNSQRARHGDGCCRIQSVVLARHRQCQFVDRVRNLAGSIMEKDGEA